MPSPDDYREMAVQDYQTDGEIAIDASGVITPTGTGAWVPAWVFVSNERFDEEANAEWRATGEGTVPSDD